MSMQIVNVETRRRAAANLDGTGHTKLVKKIHKFWRRLRKLVVHAMVRHHHLVLESVKRSSRADPCAMSMQIVNVETRKRAVANPDGTGHTKPVKKIHDLAGVID